MVVVEELLEDVHRLVDVGVPVDDHLGVGHGFPPPVGTPSLVGCAKMSIPKWRRDEGDDVADRFTTLVEGLLFPESPRWHDGRLWLSEKRAGRVLAVSPHAPADVETIAHVDGEPGGLGWRPDGTLLVVSMRTRSVVAVDAAGAISTVADLSSLTTGRCNDMVVDGTGAAYVGDFGYDLAAGAAPQPGVLVLVPVDGAPSRRGRRPPLPERLRGHTGWNDARRRRVGGQPTHRVRRGGRRQPERAARVRRSRRRRARRHRPRRRGRGVGGRSARQRRRARRRRRARCSNGSPPRRAPSPASSAAPTGARCTSARTTPRRRPRPPPPQSAASRPPPSTSRPPPDARPIGASDDRTVMLATRSGCGLRSCGGSGRRCPTSTCAWRRRRSRAPRRGSPPGSPGTCTGRAGSRTGTSARRRRRCR